MGEEKRREDKRGWERRREERTREIFTGRNITNKAKACWMGFVAECLSGSTTDRFKEGHLG